MYTHIIKNPKKMNNAYRESVRTTKRYMYSFRFLNISCSYMYLPLIVTVKRYQSHAMRVLHPFALIDTDIK